MRRTALLLMALAALGCQSSAPSGSPCTRTSECGAPGVCALGRCREQCRASRDCGPTDRCLVEPESGVGVCSLGAIDRCDTGACADGFACVNGECVNACDRIVACPDGSCVAGSCVNVRPDAGAPADAGAADAGDASRVDAGPTCAGPSCDPVAQIASGYGTICARTRGGSVYCWGRCDGSQCSAPGVALGACGCAPVPVRAMDETGQAPIADATDLAGGEGFTCAVRTGGRVWCWGGYAAPVNYGAPVPVALTIEGGGALDHVVDIEGARDRLCALRDDGALYCIGAGAAGALGNGASTDASAAAVRATELADVRAVSMAFDHTLAITSAGAVIGVGENASRELGGPSPGGGDDALQAVVNAFPLAARALSTTAGGTCALFDDPAQQDGRIGCWGDPSYGDRFGGGPFTTVACTGGSSGQCVESPAWLTTPSGDRWVGLALDQLGGVAWTEGGALWAWGTTPATSDTSFHRIDTDGITGRVVQALVHQEAVCAVTDAGEVYCRGKNDVGQLGRRSLFVTPDPYFARVSWP
ncbi:MAG: hypothetical protein U0234_06280 [Sandaracinus sp.]